MKTEYAVKACGVYNFLCALIHVFFPAMFKWAAIIADLPEKYVPFISSPLYIMNGCMAVFWAVFGILAFFYPRDFLKPGLGRAFLASLAVFWIIRMFVFQPVYVGFGDPVSPPMMAFFSVGLLLTAGPLVYSVRRGPSIP
jgi:hypothetical protein